MPSRSLITIALLIVLVEILVIGFIVNSVQKNLVEGLIAQNIEKERVIVAQVARSLEQDVKTVHDKLYLLAQRADIATGSKLDCQNEIEYAFPLLKSHAANLLRTDKKGDIYCAINKDSIGINVLGNADFKQMFEDPEHKSIIHRTAFSTVSNQYVIGVHVPVYSRDGKEFLGSLGGAIYLSELGEKYLKNLTLPKQGDMTLVDDNGDLLYAPSPESQKYIGKNLLAEEILALMPDATVKEKYVTLVKELLSEVKQGRTGISRYNNPPEPEKLSVYYPVKVSDERYWAVAMNVPVEDITRQIDDSSLISGFKSFSALFIAMVAVILVTQIGLFSYLISNSRKTRNDQ